MRDWEVRITLEGPLGTPLRSGTLFGHLCWAWRYADGEESLEAWLRALPEEPLLLSDGLPTGWLPQPLLRPWAGRPAGLTPEQAKALRRRDWVRRADFEALQPACSEDRLLRRLAASREPDGLLEHRTAHNRIDRLTGRTPPSGGLFFMDEEWPGAPPSDAWSVFARTTMDGQRLRALLTAVGEQGYGRDASVGRGQWRVASVDPVAGPLFAHRGNRLMSLSHGSLTANMRQPRYRLRTHYGKAGSLYGTGTSPFKFPLTLLRPGATFAAGEAGPFGELLGNVHPALPQVRQNAWHLTVPYTEANAEAG